MHKFGLAALAAITAFVGTGAQAAGLLNGQSVTVNLRVDSQDFGTQTVVLGDGNDGSYFNNTFFDLNGGANGDQFVYTSGGQFSSINGGSTVYWTLSNLDFGQPLTAFNILQQDVSAITIDLLTDTSVSFHYADVGIHPGVNVIGQFVTDAAPVPEPASWAMMVGGFALVGGAMRSRRKAAVSFA